MATIAAREAVQSALTSLRVARGQVGAGTSVRGLVEAAATQDERLRQLDDDALTRAVAQPFWYPIGDQISAESSIETASRVIVYVQRILNAA